MNYVIITPVKNENKTFLYTLESVLNQKKRPSEWLIIDDNSTDGTYETVERFIQSYSWIRLIKILKNPYHDYSARVVYLFNKGLEHIKEDYDIVIKLDADVTFDCDFFEKIIGEFQNNHKLGIASGHLVVDGEKEILLFNNNSTRGATKAYRKQCLLEIGGLYPYQSWDTLDGAAARAKGWITKTFPYAFNHLKREGSKAGSNIKNRFRTGLSNGRIPYRLDYFLIKAFSKASEKPAFLSTLAQIVGYIESRYILKIHPFPDYVARQVQKEQAEILKSLVRFKDVRNLWNH